MMMEGGGGGGVGGRLISQCGSAVSMDEGVRMMSNTTNGFILVIMLYIT